MPCGRCQQQAEERRARQQAAREARAERRAEEQAARAAAAQPTVRLKKG